MLDMGPNYYSTPETGCCAEYALELRWSPRGDFRRGINALSQALVCGLDLACMRYPAHGGAQCYPTEAGW